MQRDLGVVGPRRRVRDRDCGTFGIGGIGDVPATHPRDIHAGDEQPSSVRRPPVAALAPHLLSGDELRKPVGDVVILRVEQRARLTAVHLHRMQRSGSADSADVTLNLDMVKLPPLDVAVPRSRSARERAALPLSYASRSRRLDSNQYPPLKRRSNPHLRTRHGQRAVTPPRDQGSGWTRDLNPHGQFPRLIRFRSTS